MLEEKKILRHKLRELRRSIDSETLTRLSSELCRRMWDNDTLQKAGIIMSYMALPGEPQLDALHKAILQSGKKLCFPRCLGKGIMEAYLPFDASAFETGSLGIKEPIPGRSLLIPPEEIGLIICPCLGFDSSCRRLGQGGGYYDRFIPRAENAAVICAAFELQRVPVVPAEAFDRPVDAVFTELKVYRA